MLTGFPVFHRLNLFALPMRRDLTDIHATDALGGEMARPSSGHLLRRTVRVSSNASTDELRAFARLGE